MVLKRLHHQARRIKPKRKIKWEQWGLGPPPKDQPATPIEEIRQQGMILAGRLLGKGALKPLGADRVSARRGATE
jgi:hypothetical protein